MATSKAPVFDKTLYYQSIWNKIRSHPARLIFLTHLIEHGITPFYELRKLVPLARTTSSQHLRLLRKEGFVELYEKYPHSFYQANIRQCRKFAQLIKPIDDIFLNL